MAVLDAQGDGSEVGFHNFDQDSTSVQIPIDHFSSYTAEYPVDLPEIRAQALFLQSELEKRLASEAAEIVGFQRQAQLYPGLPSFGTPLSLAERILADFKNRVLARRLELAPRGCQESEEAIAAFTAYERTRQLLGVGDDPAFGLRAVQFLVPPTLMDLAIRLCFREAFQFCTRTGDFPGLAVYMYGIFERNHTMLAHDPTDAQLNLAHGYLQRCGHWRLTIETRGYIDDRILGWKQTLETTSDVELQWHAGNGQYGILGSTIDSSGDIQGSGDIQATTLEHVNDRCGQEQISNIKTTLPAAASIDDLVFDRYEGPTQTGQAIPPQPSKLTVHVHFGLLAYDLAPCADPSTTFQNSELFEWAGLLLGGTLDYVSLYANGADATVKDGWTFGLQPFTATVPKADLVDSPVIGKIDAKVTLKLEHTPEA